MTFDGAVEAEVLKLATKNALEYGKADTGTVIGKVLARFPEMKGQIKELSAYVAKSVAEVNSMSKEALAKVAEQYADEFKKEAAAKAEKSAKHSFFLEGAMEGEFVTRFPPEPNGYMQIGHAKAVFTNREFADFYKGKLALYFDDTNPEKEKQEFVDAFKQDLKWLGIKFEMEYYASDCIEQTYGYAETLINNGQAYVCSCQPEKVKEGRFKGIGCMHKTQSARENMRLWKAMLASGEQQESMILRLNGEMKSQNTVMRDPTLFRTKIHQHYRQGSKYRVWPTYDFNTPIMDSIHGMTDIMRDKKLEIRIALYDHLLDLLGLKKPRVHSFARLEIKDNVTSKRLINELVKQHGLWGYDDPRLVTIAGLRRRGIQPAAIRSFVLRFGMSKTESQVSLDMLLTENRKIVDPNAKRLFYVDKPVRMVVSGIPENAMEVKMRLHPGGEMGYRRYRLSNVFFINASDANKLSDGDQLRLKDAFNVKIKTHDENEIVAEYSTETEAQQRVHWVNEGNYVRCKIYNIGPLMDGENFNQNSMEIREGYVESYAESMAEGEIAQFERVGLYKLDSKAEFGFISL